MKKATLGQGNQILDLILQKKVSGEKLQQLLESGLLADLLEADVGQINRGGFRQTIGLVSCLAKSKIFRIVVPYSNRLEDEIASARFARINLDITDKNFSTEEEKAKGTVEIDAISIPFSGFKKTMSVTHEEMLAIFDRDGLRPGSPKELVALYKTLNTLCDNQLLLLRELPLVALGGKVWFDYNSFNLRHVVYLGRDNSERYLDLRQLPCEWHPEVHFLAVRKAT